MATVDWLQLNQYSQVVGKFHGTHSALLTHLQRQMEDVGTVTTDHQKTIYLPGAARNVTCTMVTLSFPWGDYRYIPASVM